MPPRVLANRLLEAINLGVVVLAAGKGERMGNRPKCLLEHQGEPLIRRQIHMLTALGPTDMVVVLGHYATAVNDALAQAQRALAIRTVVQSPEDHSQPDSIRLGLGALRTDVNAVMVCPSDLPLLNTADYRSLLQAFVQRGAGIGFVGPLVNGVPGNPVIFDGEVRKQIESRAGQYGCGNWRRQADDSVWNWPVDNVRYITDVDTEQDLQQLEQHHGVRLSWPQTLGCF